MLTPEQVQAIIIDPAALTVALKSVHAAQIRAELHAQYMREALANPHSFESRQLNEEIEVEMYLLRSSR